MKKQGVWLQRGDGESMSVMGAQVRFLCTADKTDRAWSLMEVVVPKGYGPPAHRHPWDEAYYVVEGAVRFAIAGEERIARAGDFIYAPGDTPHGFQGSSEQAARMLIFDAPAHAEAFFRDVEREVQRMPEDLDKVPAIGERHEVHFAD